MRSQTMAEARRSHSQPHTHNDAAGEQKNARARTVVVVNDDEMTII